MAAIFTLFGSAQLPGTLSKYASGFLDSVNMNHPEKFGANRTYGFQVIQLLVKSTFSSAAIFYFKNDLF